MDRVRIIYWQYACLCAVDRLSREIDVVSLLPLKEPCLPRDDALLVTKLLALQPQLSQSGDATDSSGGNGEPGWNVSPIDHAERIEDTTDTAARSARQATVDQDRVAAA